MPSCDCGTTSKLSGFSICSNSRILPGLLLATTRFFMPSILDRCFLGRNELAYAFLGEVHHGVQLSPRERFTFRGALQLDETAAAGHDDVHVCPTRGIF